MLAKRKTTNNLEYEFIIEEIDNPNCEYAVIPLDINTIIYGISTQENDIVFKNTDTSGVFFVPYVFIKNKSVMLARIESLAEDCAAKARIVYNKSSIPQDYKTRIFVKKYIDATTNSRYAAIYAVNANRKSQEVIDLNVYTPFTECKIADSYTLWLDTITEMSIDAKDCFGCIIDKSEVMEFESRTVAVQNLNEADTYGSDVLVLQSNENDCFAKHFHNNIFSNSYRDFKSKKSGYVYNMSKYRVKNFHDINLLAKRIIEAFRTLTGIYKCKTTILYNDVSVTAYDVSIATYAVPNNNFTQLEEKVDE